MVFWIFIGLMIVALIIGAINSMVEGYWGGVGSAAIAVFVLAIVGLFTIGIGTGAAEDNGPTRWEHQKTWALRALVTKDSTQASGSATFFLGFGSASAGSATVTKISYIRTAADGGSTLQDASIKQSVIYEDGTEQPRVEDWKKVFHNDWVWVPWSYTTTPGNVEHRFHIPKGSILENYSVKP